ncbi:MAG: hypothetical protein R2832_00030 [Rhodothermales bacterium]
MNRNYDQLTDKIVSQVLPRRSAMRRMGKAGVGLAVSTIPVMHIANAALARTRQPLNKDADGHSEFCSHSSTSRSRSTGRVLRRRTDSVVRSRRLPADSKHEDAHVNILQSTISSLGGSPVS